MAVRRLFGGILVTVGLLAILQNLDFVKLQESQIFSILLLLAGGYGYYAFTRRRQSIWLLSLALALFCWGLGKTADSWQILPISIESSLSILGISLAFVAVFFSDFRYWWAMLPGGILFVIFVVDFLSEIFYLYPGITAFLTFFGFGLVFFYLYLIRNESNHLNWAIFPAIVLFVISIFRLSVAYHWFSFEDSTAVILIGIGTALILRTLFFKREKSVTSEQDSKDFGVEMNKPPQLLNHQEDRNNIT